MLRLKARPAVLSTSCSTLSPIDTTVEVRGVQMPGIPERQGLWTNVVTPDYFETLGVALLRGRHFSASDSASSRKVAIINQATARRYFSERDPLGRTFAFGITPEEVVTIVGIAQDARQRNLRDPAPEMVYTPLTQLHEPKTGLTVEIRTAQNPSALTAAIREDVRALSPDMVVSYVRTMQQQIDASLVRESVLARLAAGFGFLALVVTCVGLYGSLSYDVARRRREIGIRMALGAARREVLWQVLRQTLVLSTTGVAIGLAAAVATTHVVSSLLFELSARDPLTLVVASAVLLTTSLVAGYLPARRAATVDPMVVLRAE